MARVLAGRIFFKAQDQDAQITWYRDVLGPRHAGLGRRRLHARGDGGPSRRRHGVSAVRADTDYMLPSTKEFMINLAVDDLDGVLARCAEHGVKPLKQFPDEFNGRFSPTSWIRRAPSSSFGNRGR